MSRCLIPIAAIVIAATPAPMLAAERFTLASPKFADNAVLPNPYAGNLAANPDCIGENRAPPLVWSHAPAGTRSFVLLMIDPEGRGGLGVVHWVAYNIPASRTGFAADEIARPPGGFTAAGARRGWTVIWARAPRRTRASTIIPSSSSPPISNPARSPPA